MTNDEVIDFVNIRLKGNEEEENILSKICEEVAFVSFPLSLILKSNSFKTSTLKHENNDNKVTGFIASRILCFWL